jgi:hypothetical protein
MKHALTALIVAIAFLGWTASAVAACSFNGRSYPTGSVVGDRECAPDGSWRQR